MTNPKNEPNPIEEAIGNRVNPPAKLTLKELQKAAKNIKKEVIQKETIPIPMNPSLIPDEPSPSEMLTLEELNRQTEERLRDEPEEETPQKAIKRAIESQEKIVTPKSPIPVSKLDHPPVTKTSSQESPPQRTESDERSQKAFEITKNVKKSNEQTLQEVNSGVGGIKRPTMAEVLEQKMNEAAKLPAEDVELTALRKYILEDGFVLATVAFHIVTLCAQPMVTPSTTTWDFRDRASVPDMVLALLNQPGYIEGIWPSLAVVMGSNKGNAAWCAGIATTIAFFDVVRTLPAIKELQKDA